MKQDPKSQKLFKLPSPPSPIKTLIVQWIWLLCRVTIIKPNETADVKNGVTVGVWSLHWACSLSQCLLMQPWTGSAHRHQAPWTETGQPGEDSCRLTVRQDGMTKSGFPSGWSDYVIVYHEAKRTQRDHLQGEISPLSREKFVLVPQLRDLHCPNAFM